MNLNETLRKIAGADKVLEEVDDGIEKLEARAREAERLDCLDCLRAALRVMEAGFPENATAKEVRQVDCMFLQMVIEIIENRK